MARGVNRVTLVGNLCADPEVRFVASGNAVCTLRLAMSERRKEGDDWKDHAEFMNVVTFGKTAENAGQFLKKGRQVYVEGRIQTRQYKDKEGNDRYSTEVVANDVLFLGGGDGAGAGKSESRTPAASAGGGTKPAGDGFAGDDLPFITAATGVEP